MKFYFFVTQSQFLNSLLQTQIQFLMQSLLGFSMIPHSMIFHFILNYFVLVLDLKYLKLPLILTRLSFVILCQSSDFNFLKSLVKRDCKLNQQTDEYHNRLICLLIQYTNQTEFELLAAIFQSVVKCFIFVWLLNLNFQ